METLLYSQTLGVVGEEINKERVLTALGALSLLVMGITVETHLFSAFVSDQLKSSHALLAYQLIVEIVPCTKADVLGNTIEGLLNKVVVVPTTLALLIDIY